MFGSSINSSAKREGATQHKNVFWETVTVEEVENKSLGIKGWADFVVSVAASSSGSRPNKIKVEKGCDKVLIEQGINKSSIPISYTDNQTQAEQKAKVLVSRDLFLESQFKLLMEEIGRSPQEYHWARSSIDELDVMKKDLKAFSDTLGTNFVDRLKAATLSPLLMKDLRKDAGSTWHSLICRYIGGSEKFYNDICYKMQEIDFTHKANNSKYEALRISKNSITINDAKKTGEA